MLWFLRLVVLLGGKNLARKALVTSSHVMMESSGSEWSHTCAWSLSENEKRRRWIAPMETPFNFSVSRTSKKIKKVKVRALHWWSSKLRYWTMETSIGLNLKLFTSTVGLAILDEMPWTPGVMKSWSVLHPLILHQSLVMFPVLYAFSQVVSSFSLCEKSFQSQCRVHMQMEFT